MREKTYFYFKLYFVNRTYKLDKADDGNILTLTQNKTFVSLDLIPAFSVNRIQ